VQGLAQGRVQAVERAFAILDAVSGRPAGVTTIAHRVGLPKSTVARLLGTLEDLDAVERLDGARWRLGSGVAALAGTASPERSLVAVARPHLAQLVEEVGEDAGLALPDGYDAHYVDQVESDNPVQVRDWTGTRAPLHAVPSGLVLLAEWPEDALDAYIARDLHTLTPRTLSSPVPLRRRLEEVRGQGFAWGIEEFAEGISSVAAPVRDGRGHPIAALHLHGPSYRFPPAEGGARIAELVVGAAAAVGRELAMGAAG
jgi:IclR family transcriptional regulator, KDG regulon repressor